MTQASKSKESNRCPKCKTPILVRDCPTCPKNYIGQCKKCGTKFLVKDSKIAGEMK